MDVKKVLEAAIKDLQSATIQQDLYEVRVSYLGKKGKITELLKSLKDLSLEEKKSVGAELNAARESVETFYQKRLNLLNGEEINQKLLNESIDITFPPPSPTIAKVHPISQTFDEVISIFGSMGYEVAEGPDIETDFFNFSALNIPEDHPAREMQDTFYINSFDDLLYIQKLFYV